MRRWRLKRGLDRRFRSGHPWVFSNEIIERPTTAQVGELVEMRDEKDQFLAVGYANPNSLICFRAIERTPPGKLEPFSLDWLVPRFKWMMRLRTRLGFASASYRLCYGEGDFLPGLIVDYFERTDGRLVFVVQAHTAGIDQRLNVICDALKALVPADAAYAIVIRNDLRVRKLEGLLEEAPRVQTGWGESTEDDLRRSEIWIRSVHSDKKTDRLKMTCDLFEGQKTGYFFDQFANIQLAWGFMRPWFEGSTQLKMIDLCSYVGQWSAQLGHSFASEKIKVETTLVDASAAALAFAKNNFIVNANSELVETLEGDVLKDLEALPSQKFDIVICDPPAFIKSKKDIEPGKHAYMKLNAEAFRLVKKGGVVVTCSCSAVLDDEGFAATVMKASRRAGVTVQWLGRGGSSPDHPKLLEFPEAHYLKAWVGLSL
jgi:23S rRNA (cytosine1962-C5)-methyltransferase